jgi:hypothetical protein
VRIGVDSERDAGSRQSYPEVTMHGDMSRQAGVAALAACLALAGCKVKDTAATTDTTAMGRGAGMGDSTAAAARASSSDMTASAAASAGARLSDANIAALLDEANAGDSTLAAAALPKLTSARAKTFAKMMMGEHHALHMEGLRVEKEQGIIPVLPTPDPFKPAVEGEQQALSALAKGPVYDSTYIANEVGIHQAVLDWAGKNTPQNAGLQRYLKAAGPVLEKHLREARAFKKG